MECEIAVDWSRASWRLLGHRVRVATHLAQRLRGLLGTARLGFGQGLLIRPCGSVHTFGMRYPIDVLFLDARATVLDLEHVLTPGRCRVASGAAMALELCAGTLHRLDVRPGERVVFEQAGGALLRAWLARDPA